MWSHSFFCEDFSINNLCACELMSYQLAKCWKQLLFDWTQMRSFSYRKLVTAVWRIWLGNHDFLCDINYFQKSIHFYRMQILHCRGEKVLFSLKIRVLSLSQILTCMSCVLVICWLKYSNFIGCCSWIHMTHWHAFTCFDRYSYMICLIVVWIKNDEKLVSMLIFFQFHEEQTVFSQKCSIDLTTYKYDSSE